MMIRHYLHSRKILLYIVCGVLGYAGISQGRAQQSQREKIPEYIQVHLNKPYFVAGEDIWYAAYLWGQPVNQIQSKILRVELLYPDGRVVLSQKLRIEAGAARGDISLPAQLPTGYYAMRVYTLWNLNFEPPEIWEKWIPVIGLTPVAETASSSPSVSQLLSLEELPALEAQGLNVATHKHIYRPREEVQLSLKLTDSATPSPKGRVSISVVQEAYLPKDWRGGNERVGEKQLRKPGVFTPKFEPEKRFAVGLNLWSSIDGSPINSNFVVGVVKDYLQVDFSYTQQGKTRVQFDEIYDRITVQVFDANPMKPELSPRIAEQAEQIPLPPLSPPVEPYNLDSLAQLYLGHHLKQTSLISLFGVEAAHRANMQSTPIPETPPDASFRVDDYIIFQDLFTFVKEVVSPVQIERVKKDTVGFNVLLDGSELRGYRNRQIRRFPTMYMVNGYLTSDFEAVTSIPWENIGQIDVYNRLIRLRNLFGPVGIAGVIAFYTRDGTTPTAIQNAPNNLRMAGYYTPRLFAAPDYTENSAESSKVPDFRPLLYWQSHISINADFTTPINFFTNDQVGTFWVRVEGITDAGKLISAMTHFQVGMEEE